MVVRGFQGPEKHSLYMMKVNPTSWVANFVSLLTLVLFAFAVAYWK